MWLFEPDVNSSIFKNPTLKQTFDIHHTRSNKIVSIIFIYFYVKQNHAKLNYFFVTCKMDYRTAKCLLSVYPITGSSNRTEQQSIHQCLSLSNLHPTSSIPPPPSPP